MTVWTDRRVLVTGASRGIGRRVADQLAASGATVAITATTPEAAERARNSILDVNPQSTVSAHAFDQADPDATSVLVREIKAELDGLDHVVANAGTHKASPIGMVSSADAEQLLLVNARGPLLLVQSALKLLRRSAAPAVVLIGSLMGTDGVSGQTAYAMSKGAVHGLLRPLSRELGASGVRINAVAPGYVETDMTSSLSEQQREEVERRTPLGRLGTPAEVANAVQFLLSDEAGFITGQCLGVDGGLTN